MNRIFLVYGADLDVKAYKLEVFDELKTLTVLDKYVDMIIKDNQHDILDYATGMINVFFDNNDRYYIDLVKKIC